MSNHYVVYMPKTNNKIKKRKERKADRCIQEGRQGQNMGNFNADIIPGECTESFTRPFFC